MMRRRRERAALRELQRRVWGENSYNAHVDELKRTRKRRANVLVILGGAQLLLAALALAIFPTAASAHTSQITIGCTQVEFNYAEFPQTSVTAHESILIDGVQGPQRDFQFTGPTAVDIIMITVAAGAHTIDASTNWTFFGQPQGSAQLTQDVSDCTPETTSTSTTTSTMPTTSTTVAESTTVPTTSTSIPAPTTTSLTISSTSTSLAGTTTSIPVVPQGSTTSLATIPPATVVTTPPTSLPFTGSSTRPLSFALAAIGLGVIATGLAQLKRAGRAD